MVKSKVNKPAFNPESALQNLSNEHPKLKQQIAQAANAKRELNKTINKIEEFKKLIGTPKLRVKSRVEFYVYAIKFDIDSFKKQYNAYIKMLTDIYDSSVMKRTYKALKDYWLLNMF